MTKEKSCPKTELKNLIKAWEIANKDRGMDFLSCCHKLSYYDGLVQGALEMAKYKDDIDFRIFDQEIYLTSEMARQVVQYILDHPNKNICLKSVNEAISHHINASTYSDGRDLCPPLSGTNEEENIYDDTIDVDEY